MASNFVSITHEEMWNTVQNIESNMPDGVEVFSITNNFTRGEEVYEFKGNHPLNAIMIYTSIRKDTRRGRDLGKDAIRIVVCFSGIYKHFCRIYRTEGWQVRLHNRILEAYEQYPLVVSPIKQIQECIFCGDPEVNGTTEDGNPVCAWHQHVVMGVDLGNKPDTGVVAQFKEGKLVAFSYLGRA